MNITINSETRDALLEKLKQKNKSVVRLLIAGFGWGGPTLSVVLDEQKDNDITTTVDGITFVSNKDEEYIFNNCQVSRKKTFFGETFSVKSDVIGEGSCS